MVSQQNRFCFMLLPLVLLFVVYNNIAVVKVIDESNAANEIDVGEIYASGGNQLSILGVSFEYKLVGNNQTEDLFEFVKLLRQKSLSEKNAEEFAPRTNLFSVDRLVLEPRVSWKLLLDLLRGPHFYTKTSGVLHVVDHPLRSISKCIELSNSGIDFTTIRKDIHEVYKILGKHSSAYGWVKRGFWINDNSFHLTWKDCCVSYYIIWNTVIKQAGDRTGQYTIYKEEKTDSVSYDSNAWMLAYKELELSDHIFAKLVELATVYGFQLDDLTRSVAFEIAKFGKSLRPNVFLNEGSNYLTPEDHTNCHSPKSFCCSILKYGPKSTWSCLPKLILIGTQKGATGELGGWLQRNPRIVRYGGEPHFFDKYNPPNIYDATIKQYKLIRKEWPNDISIPSGISKTPHKYLSKYRPKEIRYSTVEKREIYIKKLMRGVGGRQSETAKILGGLTGFEKTPSYLDRVSPKDVRTVVPGAKIMVILRNPVKRLHSSYWHFCNMAKLQTCSATEFRDWVGHVLRAKDIKSADTVALRSIAYGLYVDYLEEWFKYFNEPGRLLVIFTESFQKDPFETMDGIEKYFGLPHVNYKSHARKVNNLWVISQRSKTIQESVKPRGYSKLKEDKEMEAAVNDLYKTSLIRLRRLLTLKNQTSSVPVMFQDFPDWLQV